MFLSIFFLFFFLSGIFTEYETSRVASRIEIESSLKKFTGFVGLKIRISIIFTNSICILSILKNRREWSNEEGRIALFLSLLKFKTRKKAHMFELQSYFPFPQRFRIRKKWFRGKKTLRLNSWHFAIIHFRLITEFAKQNLQSNNLKSV